MKIFIFATPNEAQATIKKLNSKMIEEHVYKSGSDLIIISGIGSLAALRAVLKYGIAADEIINLGIAGSLNPNLDLGHITEISAVDKFLPHMDPVASKAFPPLSIQTQGLKLLTSDFPIHENELRKKLSPNWDLIDMEGYGIAYGALALGKKFRLVKIVSDFASENGRDLILKNIEKNSMRLAESCLLDNPF